MAAYIILNYYYTIDKVCDTAMHLPETNIKSGNPLISTYASQASKTAAQKNFAGTRLRSPQHIK